MSLTLPKLPLTMASRKTFLSILAPVSGLAVFFILASSILVSQPIGSAVRGYFYGDHHSEKSDFTSAVNESVHDFQNDSHATKHASSSASMMSSSNKTIEEHLNFEHGESIIDARESWNNDGIDPNKPSETKNEKGFTKAGKGEVHVGSNVISSNSTEPQLDSEAKLEKTVSLSPALSNANQTISADPGCDLFQGRWVYDSSGPLYKNDSCPVLTQTQNCQGNGRPDKEYENWRWKPSQCDLPRFDPKRFLELMKGKTLSFIGDSVARNQMESLLCILWQVEVPKNRGNRRMQRYYFRSTNTMIIRVWSSWLVHQTSEAFDFAPQGVAKLHLDAPDENLMELIPNCDVVILSSGHWFAKQSAYILNNEIVGGQLWWPDKSRPQKIGSVEAFKISVETILTAIVTHSNYSGLTIVRTYSPDHYEGGAWNTGGSCTGKVKPASDGELVQNGFTNIMHENQLGGFYHAIKKQTNKSRLRLLDITQAFSYRHDGHPGPYRNTDPDKITKRGPGGKPPPQDCLHWCMPGAIDTWNEMMFEIIRRDHSGS